MTHFLSLINTNILVYCLETLAILSFAVSGMLVAEKKDFDPVGWYIISCITAFGGGTLRDLVLDVHPVFWVEHAEYLIIIFFITLLFYFISKLRIPKSCLLISDSLGLALFSVTTADTIYRSGYPIIIALILAVMAATFGGLLRDVFCNEVPMIFKKVNFYASIVFLGVAIYVGMLVFGIEGLAPMTGAIVFIFVFRLLAVRFKWKFR